MGRKSQVEKATAIGSAPFPRTASVGFAAALVVVYLVVFFAQQLPSLGAATPDGRSWYRYDFLLLLLTPGQLIAGLSERWFGQPGDFGIFDRLPIVAIAAVIFTVALAAGWLALRMIGLANRLERLEQFVFAAAVGLSLVSGVTLLLGLFGILHSPLPFALIAAAILALVSRSWKNYLLVEGRGKKSAKKSNTVAEHHTKVDVWDSVSVRAVLTLTFPFVAALLLGGMLPPLDFDVLEYHLQAPKEFFQAGRVTFLPHNVYGNMPLGAEMLALAAMVVADDWWLGALSGKLLMAVFAPLTATLLFSAGVRWFTPLVGAVAALIYISTPWIQRVSTSGLVEGVLGFYIVAAGYAFCLWWQAGASDRSDNKATRPTSVNTAASDNRWLWLSGFLAGAATTIKYTAVPLVLLPLAAAVVAARRQSARSLGMFLLAAAIPSCLWFGKNWVFTGNPTYPLLYAVFDGETRTPEKGEQWSAAHHPDDYAAADFVNRLKRLVLTSEWISPLIAPFAVLAILVRRIRRLVWPLLIYAAVYWLIWWTFTHRLDRFWVPLLPAFALVAAAGVCWRSDRLWNWSVAGVFSVALLYCLIVDVSGPGGYNRYFVRIDRLRDDPERVPAWISYLNENLTDEEQVLAVGDAAMFDLRVPVDYNTVFDTCRLEQMVRDRSPEEIRRNFMDLSHVYVNWGEIARYRSPGNYGFTDFVQPAVFERLIEQGILGEPVAEFADGQVQIFPVLAATAPPQTKPSPSSETQ